MKAINPSRLTVAKKVLLQKTLAFLLWLDIEAFALITFGGSRKGETISAASWSLLLDGKYQGRVAVPIIDWLFSPWQKNHCKNAYLWQIEIYVKD